MDVVLLIVLILMPVFFVFVNFRLLNFYLHPSEEKHGLVAALTVGEVSIMLLPFDVANRGGQIGCGSWNRSCGGFTFMVPWQIFLYLVLILAAGVVPFFMLFYESDESDIHETRLTSRYGSSICYSGLLLVIVFAVILICYFIFGNVDIPVSLVRVESIGLNGPQFGDYLNQTAPIPSLCAIDYCASLSSRLRLRSSFPIFTIAIMTFLGWIALAFFAGIGLPTLPVDLINNFVHRPTYLNKTQFLTEKRKTDKKLVDLIEYGEQLKADEAKLGEGVSGFWAKRRQKTEFTQSVNRFKNEVYMIEKEYIDLNARHAGYKEYNPLYPIASLVGGIFGIVITVLWILHICLYVIPQQAGVVPPTTMLNWFLIKMDKLSVIFGMIGFGIFVVYFLFCSIKGVFKFGLRCFCVAIHPMEEHGTYMVSFLFNICLVLLCSAPVLQFTCFVFQDYVGNSDAQVIFNLMVSNMVFLQFFFRYNVFVYAMLIIAVLACFYLIREIKSDLEIRQERRVTNLQRQKERQRAKEQEIADALAPPESGEGESEVVPAESAPGPKRGRKRSAAA